MPKQLIFVVDDEAHIQELVKFNLEAAGYKVITFGSGEEVVETVKSSTPDLFVLDLMLPGIDGLEVCKRLRADPAAKNVPIMMLTAKTDEFDKVLGLELGADDYLTKPFGVRELVARVKAILRRVANTAPSGSETGDEILKYADIEMNLTRHEVFKNGKLIDMPFKEFELLKMLLQNKGKVLSRDTLLGEIWSFDYQGETRTVDVHIRYLRQKIEDNGSKPAYIETIRGVGYRLNDREKPESGS